MKILLNARAYFWEDCHANSGMEYFNFFTLQKHQPIVSYIAVSSYCVVAQHISKCSYNIICLNLQSWSARDFWYRWRMKLQLRNSTKEKRRTENAAECFDTNNEWKKTLWRREKSRKKFTCEGIFSSPPPFYDFILRGSNLYYLVLILS